MPFDKYLIIKKAAEIDELMNRLNLITDINAAFSGGKEHVKQLESKLNVLLSIGPSDSDPILHLNPKDPNWKTKLLKYKR
jgi:hypothetical protein